MSSKPLASVIIPVFQDVGPLEKTLEALSSQTVSDFETIVVDNGAPETLSDVVVKYPDVIWLKELHNLGSPYSARNRGLEVAAGEVIVLLDATCFPAPDWLEKGLQYLDKSSADLIGGNVLFDYGPKTDAAKIYDSLTNIRMRHAIETRKVAKTASLFVNKAVFDKVGPFVEGIRSGGDVRWTNKATQAGFQLLFCEEAKVYKVARSYIALYGKQWRISLAHPAVWEEDGRQQPFYRYLVSFLRPPRRPSIAKMIRERGTEEMLAHLNSVWLVAIIMHFIGKTGHICGYFKLRLGPKK